MKKENKDWLYYVDNDEGGNVLNDPILKQKVIRATRRYVKSMFDDEDTEYHLKVSVVDVETEPFTPPHHGVKVVVDFSIDPDDDENEQTLKEIIGILNRRLEIELEDRYATAKLSLSKISNSRYFIHLEYVGPGMYDNTGNSLESRDDYFKALMVPIKEDIDLIMYKLIGKYYGWI